MPLALCNTGARRSNMQGAMQKAHLGKNCSLRSRLATSLAPFQTSRNQACLSRRCRLSTQASQQAAPVDFEVQSTGDSGTGKAQLSLKVADPTKSKGLVHRHVIMIQQNARQGSANTKTRAEVRGGGKKPFAQKGTGNARQGSSTTPLKPGGGVIFGPKPKDWSIKMNKKERRLAIATALQSAASSITVVDDIKSKITEFKTKALVEAISGFGADLEKEHVLLIVEEITDALNRSGRNIKNLNFNKSSSLNTYDILRADKIVMDKASLDFVNDFYGSSQTESQ